MKVLVTGATGFLGSYLIKSLVQQGHQVAIIKRSFSKVWRIKSVLNKIAVYDIDKCGLAQPFKDSGSFDAVIHTATCYGRNGESLQQIIEANTLFPLKLLEMAAEFNTTAFLNTDTILSKDLNGYALAKNHFKEWGKMIAGLKKIQFINIKVEHMYGPDDDESKFVTYIIKNCLNNVPKLKLTLGEQKRDFIYVDDVIAAYNVLLTEGLAKKELYQEYEIGSGMPVSIRHLVESVHRATNSNTELQFGAIPYRQNELMESCTNNTSLVAFGWQPKVDLTTGLEYVIRKERQI